MSNPESADASAVKGYLNELQDRITAAAEKIDSVTFRRDPWNRPEIAGAPFEAMGLSLVFHPRNPYAPTTHCNVRFLIARPATGAEVWWFGGGFDLTPHYPYDEDVLHWHRTARDACQEFGA